MSDPRAQVSIRILDKEYQVECPADERTDLLDSAEVLNEKMREIRDSGRIVGLDDFALGQASVLKNPLRRDSLARTRESTSRWRATLRSGPPRGRPFP